MHYYLNPHFVLVGILPVRHYPYFFLILTLIILFLIGYIIKYRRLVKDIVISRRVFSKIQSNSCTMSIIYTINEHFRVNYISESVFFCLGYSQEEIIKRKVSFHDLIHKSDIETLRKIIQTIDPQKRNYQIEYRIKTKWGNEKWMLEQGFGIFDRKNSLLALESIITDISESKINEVFLQESEKRFQVLFESSPIGICISYDNIITYCNPVYLNLFKYTQFNDLIGTSVFNTISPDQHNDLKKIIKSFTSENQLVKKIGTIGFCKDESSFPMQMYLTKVQLGDFSGLIIFIIDITDLKKKEEDLKSLNEQLTNIIELIPDPTFVIDNNKRVTHWNRAIEELCGINKSKILDKGDNSYSKAFYGDNRPMLIDLVDQDLNSLKTNYFNVKKINEKLYAEYTGPIVNTSSQLNLWGVAAPLYDNKNRRFGTIEVIKDITEAKQREVALFESEEKARIVLDTSQDLIILILPDGTILDCNKSFANLYNKTREELIKTNIFNYYDQQLIQQRKKDIQMVLLTGSEMVTEDFSCDLSSYYITSIYPVKNEINEIKRFVISSKNITKLKQVEQELRLKEEQYRIITEFITDYLYKLTYNNGVLEFSFDNAGLEKIIGYRNTDFQSDPDSFRKIIFLDDKQLFDSFIELVIRNKENKAIEHRLIHKNGKIIWISNTLLYYRKINECTFEFIGVLKDITLRKHLEIALLDAEERYRNVFDQSGLASFVFDLSGKLFMQNALAAELLESESSECLGKTIEELFPPKMALDIRNKIKITLANGFISDECEVEMNSGKRWLKITTHLIKNMNNDIIGIQFIIQDVSEKRIHDRMLMNIMIETEEKERANFAQELHDGLGPLMSTIKMYIQWLAKPVVNVSRVEIYEDIQNLVEEAILVTREISFKLSPHILINLGLIEAIKVFVGKVNQVGNIKIVMETNLTDRLNIITETVLYRILCEAINNTVKHASATIISIQINRTPEGLVLIYKDNGIGFDKEQVMASKKGNGLFNISNRLQSLDATVSINSKQGNGMEIVIFVKI